VVQVVQVVQRIRNKSK